MKRFTIALTILFTLSVFCSAHAQSKTVTDKFYIKPYAGFIEIQDMNIQLVDNNSAENLNIESGFGYTAGISFGYNFYKNFTAEIGWEYKSNNITITNSNSFNKGDYASNFIYLNGIYNIKTNGSFTPYVGLGFSFIEEIDLDLSEDENNSFSKSGIGGFQGLVGLDYDFAKKWGLNCEVKFVKFNNFNVINESNGSILTNLKYNPLIINIGMKYRF